MEIEWDPEKDAANRAKHGIGLAEAQGMTDPRVSFPDVRNDYGEERSVELSWIADRLYVCVYTIRGGRRRIISLRKANARERRLHAQALAPDE